MVPARLRGLLSAQPSPFAAEQAALEEYLREFVARVEATPGLYYWSLKPQEFEFGRGLLARSPVEQVRLLHTALEMRGTMPNDLETRAPMQAALWSLISALVRRKLPCTEADVLRLLDPVVFRNVGIDTVASLLRYVERYLAEHPVTPAIREALLVFRIPLQRYQITTARRLLQKIGEWIGDQAPAGLNPGEAWADAVIEALQREESGQRATWEELLAHARSATASRPSAKWHKEASARIERVGYDEVRQALHAWLPRVTAGSNQPLDDSNADVLKGLLWCCLLLEDPTLTRPVADVTQSAYKKIPQVGQRSTKVGNAGLYVLGQLQGREAVEQLARLKLVVKQRSAQTAIEKTLGAVSEREGISLHELEEISVPTFGLVEPGLLLRQLDAYSAEITFPSGGAPIWRWLREDGRTQKSVPAAVRERHAPELAELKRAVKDVQTMLAAQRERLERLYLENRAIRFADWKTRYLDHPVVGQLARRLIWRVGERESAIWQAGRLVTADGVPIAEPSPEAPVTLWHPVEASIAEVLAWRGWLETREVRQPFKQAHREVYLLTEAEVNTRVYSNRFAAHILKQHQFNALADQKGWRYHLQGAFDGGYDSGATLEIPAWELRAEFWVDAVAKDETWTDAGIYLYLTTDQLRFVGAGGEARPLLDMPRLVLSEVMRMVDLFVGVASIGNDPAWEDQGGGRYREYWQSYSFGDLNAAAETRKAVLERLLPRLRIASRSRVEGRNLVVEGSVRTYKIHLGSGNVLMEPNDQYLCIVPDRSKPNREADSLFLPFEGDRVLALILSKAFLLADDTRITDSTILSQIGRIVR